MAPQRWSWFPGQFGGKAKGGLPTDHVALSIEVVTPTKDPDASRNKKNWFN
jgi:hypothetical protein